MSHIYLFFLLEVMVSGECLTTRSWGWGWEFVVFADFHGVHIPIIADFK